MDFSSPDSLSEKPLLTEVGSAQYQREQLQTLSKLSTHLAGRGVMLERLLLCFCVVGLMGAAFSFHLSPILWRSLLAFVVASALTQYLSFRDETGRGCSCTLIGFVTVAAVLSALGDFSSWRLKIVPLCFGVLGFGLGTLISKERMRLQSYQLSQDRLDELTKRVQGMEKELESEFILFLRNGSGEILRKSGGDPASRWDEAVVSRVVEARQDHVCIGLGHSQDPTPSSKLTELFLSNEKWFEVVCHLMDKAALILVAVSEFEPNRQEYLRKELRHILESDERTEKTIVVPGSFKCLEGLRTFESEVAIEGKKSTASSKWRYFFNHLPNASTSVYKEHDFEAFARDLSKTEGYDVVREHNIVWNTFGLKHEGNKLVKVVEAYAGPEWIGTSALVSPFLGVTVLFLKGAMMALPFFACFAAALWFIQTKTEPKDLSIPLEFKPDGSARPSRFSVVEHTGDYPSDKRFELSFNGHQICATGARVRFESLFELLRYYRRPLEVVSSFHPHPHEVN